MHIMPVARGLIICEKASVTAGTKNLSLSECFRRVHAPRFLMAVKPFFVVAHLVNGLGEVPIQVNIYRMSDNYTCYKFSGSLVFPDRLIDVRFKLQVTKFTAPSPGG